MCIFFIYNGGKCPQIGFILNKTFTGIMNFKEWKRLCCEFPLPLWTKEPSLCNVLKAVLSDRDASATASSRELALSWGRPTTRAAPRAPYVRTWSRRRPANWTSPASRTIGSSPTSAPVCPWAAVLAARAWPHAPSTARGVTPDQSRTGEGSSELLSSQPPGLKPYYHIVSELIPR